MSRFPAKYAAGAAGVLFSGVYLRRLAEVDRQVTRYRRAWEDHNLWTLRHLQSGGQTGGESERPFLLVALGDSAAQGVGAKTVERGYVPRLAAGIRQVLDRPVALLNLSVSGATIETVLTYQLPLLEGLGFGAAGGRPDLVVANIGGNDVRLTSLTPDLFSNYLQRVVAKLPSGSLIGNVPSFSILAADRKAEELSEMIDQIAGKHGHLPVDLRALTLSYNPTDYIVRYHAADLFHPNARAYGQWADLFLDRWREAEGHPIGHQEALPWQMETVRREAGRSRPTDR